MIFVVLLTCIGVGLFGVGCLVGRWVELQVITRQTDGCSTCRSAAAHLVALHRPMAERGRR